MAFNTVCNLSPAGTANFPGDGHFLAASLCTPPNKKLNPDKVPGLSHKERLLSP